MTGLTTAGMRLLHAITAPPSGRTLIQPTPQGLYRLHGKDEAFRWSLYERLEQQGWLTIDKTPTGWYVTATDAALARTGRLVRPLTGPEKRLLKAIASLAQPPAPVERSAPGVYRVVGVGVAARVVTWTALEEELGLIEVTHGHDHSPMQVAPTERGRLVALSGVWKAR